MVDSRDVVPMLQCGRQPARPLGRSPSATVLGVPGAWRWWYAAHGFDPADEGFYLVWISEPRSFRTSVSQFGFVYHPLYDAGRTATSPRCAGPHLLLTAGLAVWVGAARRASATGARRLAVVRRLPGGHPALRLQPVAGHPELQLPHRAGRVGRRGRSTRRVGAPRAPKAVGRPRPTGALAGAVVLGVGGALMVLAKPTTAMAIGAHRGRHPAAGPPAESLRSGGRP